MGSLSQARRSGDLVTTQVSLGGFDANVSARDLADFLELEAGQVWRCRVKTSWTPPESYPDFLLRADATSLAAPPHYDRVPPHAFVHFARPEAARRAADAAGRSELLLARKPLRAASAPESSLRASRRRSTAPFRFPGSRLEVGELPAPDSFLAAWRGPDSGVEFSVDPFDGLCRLVFTRDTAFAFPGYRGVAVVMRCDVKLEFSVRDIAEVRVFRIDCSLLLRLSAAPLVYYRTADDDIHESVPFDLLDDDDPWIRATDITPSGAIGRCGVYRVTFSPRFWPKMDRALAYMKERRVAIVECGGGWGARRGLTVRDEPEFGEQMQDLFFCVQHAEGLKFPVLFLVNALVHKGIINQHQLTPEFFGLLKRSEDDVNVAALREFWGDKFPVFDACRRLKKAQDMVSRNPKLLCSKIGNDNAEVRRLVITPTRAYCLPPEVERSNRVIRHYHEVADRFLRVAFMDEGMQSLNSNVLSFSAAPIVKDLMSTWLQQKTTVYKRVRIFLTEGFHMCGRKYSFLAFSSNQLRDRSAWFFAEDSKTRVESIRKWMGRFTNKNVAKHAARMGQCFSSTYATVMMQPAEVNECLEDVEHNGYIFSDGIGKITPDLAIEVAKSLPLTDSPPSAYQIRYAGFKGVIAVWQGENDGIRLSLRPSMHKFESNHSVLEVVSWTRFQPGFLNRQIITLLSSLNVPDAIFSQMQETMLSNLNKILSDSDVAFEVVTTSCAEQGNTAALMLSAGFVPGAEPHLKAMLLAIRSAQCQDLLGKTRIFVPKGRWLMGCLDELGVLEQGQCFIRASAPSLNNCFVKHGLEFPSANKNADVIVGMVVIAKNPCLHPGDVRILEAVDVHELHHLVDCLVFPKKGERPHANEASGSDLDGDLYFVTWDEKLIPPGKKSWNPMDYSPAEAKQLPRQVSQHDIIDFFLKNMVNENLGVICNAHVVHADLSEYGAMDEKCIHLAELAATAVDFPKTGKLVTMPPSLRPKIYPDFMGKEDSMSYKSEKILGRLYRSIQEASSSDLVSEETCALNDLPYDTDLEVPGALDFLSSAWQCKCSYEAQLNALLNQYKVRTEAELVTEHIWSLPKYNSRKQGDMKERLKNAYSALRKEFRSIFESMETDQTEIPDDEKNRVYAMKASAWYQVTYHPKWVQKSREMLEPEGQETPARLSFAWIPVDYLVRIKIRCRGEVKVDGRRPVERLAAYISEM
ncbi:probable RNA-dependent RNA polymerase SHL2 [Phragmites australis]|uniref:probable RNA-dependent RNA polymerase SHL2 n=1 Tax=Phragmites australis TaxID=29695 RepID=UPI002D79B420|nr:probable RNA-dependent RNA polymerase SHL2 [Phragmites australis]